MARRKGVGYSTPSRSNDTNGHLSGIVTSEDPCETLYLYLYPCFWKTDNTLFWYLSTFIEVSKITAFSCRPMKLQVDILDTTGRIGTAATCSWMKGAYRQPLLVGCCVREISCKIELTAKGASRDTATARVLAFNHPTTEY